MEAEKGLKEGDGSEASPALRAKRETGGAAFPVYPRIEGGKAWLRTDAEGMTLRDYFAAKALSGVCDFEMFMACDTAEACAMQITNAANLSYRLADAMIAARNQD